MGRPDSSPDWPFLGGPGETTRRIADAAGVYYKHDPVSGEWAHMAAIFVLTPDGKVSRYLYGVEFPAKDLRLAVVEASQGKVGTSFDRILLTCYRYDTARREYVPYALGFVRAGAVAVLGALAVTLGVYWRRELRGKGGR